MTEEITSDALKDAEHQVRTFKRRRDNYVTFAEALQKILEHVADKHAPLAVVQARAKTIPSFADKAIRKRHKRPDPVNQFTDLCGARVICHTVYQVAAVGEYIKRHFDIDWENSVDTSERLRATEFGYRSVHYIVTFREKAFPNSDVPVEIPSVLLPGGMQNPRAEVQVRTFLEHAWADVAHDLLYKGGFAVPRAWNREFARLAAVLENADGAITHLHDGLHTYADSYAYMDEKQMRDRIRQREFVLKHDPGDLDVVREIAALAILLGDWDKAIVTLKPHLEKGDPAIMRDYGRAVCGKHADQPHGGGYEKGRAKIDEAAHLPAADAEAWIALADAWRDVDPDRARNYYQEAYELDPDNARALESYLELQIRSESDLAVVEVVRPMIEAAAGRCRERIAMGIDLPAAYFALGKFRLLLSDPFAALSAYGRGATKAVAPHQIEDALRSLELLQPVARDLEGYAWSLSMLLLSLATWYERPGAGEAPDEVDSAVRRARDRVAKLATPNAAPVAAPVVIVAGGCDPALDKELRKYRRLLFEGFEGYCGTVTSGGTREGISGLVGAMARRQGDRVMAMSWLPESLPWDAHRDDRYHEHRPAPGDSFTPMQPLQTWIDIVASGIPPATVRLLGINGGPISGAEYRMALALGATVALVEESGREAARLAPDEDWGDADRLLRIPADPLIVREFVIAANPCLQLDPALRERLAQRVHSTYCIAKRKSLEKQQPSLAPWSRLHPALKESSRAQVDGIVRKLEKLELTVAAVKGASPKRHEFTPAQLERLAEVEHARWVVERLQSGWRRAEKSDPEAKTSPYLVPWKELTDDIKEYDRVAVREIPDHLSAVGLKIVPRPGTAGKAAGRSTGPRPRGSRTKDAAGKTKSGSGRAKRTARKPAR